MKNIKGFAVATDGNMKRIAITYDEIDDVGKVVNANVKVNRLITDTEALSAVSILETFGQNVIND